MKNLRLATSTESVSVRDIKGMDGSGADLRELENHPLAKVQIAALRGPGSHIGMDEIHLSRYDNSPYVQWVGRTAGGTFKPIGLVMVIDEDAPEVKVFDNITYVREDYHDQLIAENEALRTSNRPGLGEIEAYYTLAREIGTPVVEKVDALVARISKLEYALKCADALIAGELGSDWGDHHGADWNIITNALEGDLTPDHCGAHGGSLDPKARCRFPKGHPEKYHSSDGSRTTDAGAHGYYWV